MITSGFAMAAESLAVSVSKLDAVAGFGLNEAVKPLDRPATAKLTLPLNPVRGAMVIVDCRDAPWYKPADPTEELMVKVGTMTVRTNVVCTTFEPHVPETVTV
jgi:hypothetical protein